MRAWSLAILAGSLAGCATTPEVYEQRMQDTYAFIEAWERAVTGEADDRGWSMLSTSARSGFADEAQYVALAEAADWAAFEVTPVIGHCDDLWACSISVVVSREANAIPDFLRHAPLDRDGKRLPLLVIVDQDDDGRPDAPDDGGGNGFMSVWWGRLPWPDPRIGGNIGG